MKITLERFYDLGLGVSKECCGCCDFCYQDENGRLVCEDDPEMDIEKAEQNHEFAPCLDEQRLQYEMTDEEYDAYRHGRLEVEEDGCI